MIRQTPDPDPPPRIGIVVVAAGSGTRLGAGLPKAFARLAGRPLLRHALDRVDRFRTAVGPPGAVALVVVIPPAMATGFADRYRSDLALGDDVAVVAGGTERGDSVLIGLRALPADVEIVLVHDAARCLTPPAVFDRVSRAVAAGASAAIPGIAVVDTIKQIDSRGSVTSTPDRATLRSIQTPQAFRRDVLVRAHAEHGSLASDDAGLVERLGLEVRVVEGAPEAFKITTPEDLARAERVLLADAGASTDQLAAR